MNPRNIGGSIPSRFSASPDLPAKYRPSPIAVYRLPPIYFPDPLGYSAGNLDPRGPGRHSCHQQKKGTHDPLHSCETMRFLRGTRRGQGDARIFHRTLLRGELQRLRTLQGSAGDRTGSGAGRYLSERRCFPQPFRLVRHPAENSGCQALPQPLSRRVADLRTGKNSSLFRPSSGNPANSQAILKPAPSPAPVVFAPLPVHPLRFHFYPGCFFCQPLPSSPVLGIDKH